MKNILQKELDTIIIIILGAIITLFRGYAVEAFLHAVEYEAVVAAKANLDQLQIYINGYTIAYILYESIWCKKVYTKVSSWRTFFTKHIKIIVCQLILCIDIALCFDQMSTAFHIISLQISVFIITTLIAYAMYKYYEIVSIIKRK